MKRSRTFFSLISNTSCIPTSSLRGSGTWMQIVNKWPRTYRLPSKYKWKLRHRVDSAFQFKGLFPTFLLTFFFRHFGELNCMFPKDSTLPTHSRTFPQMQSFRIGYFRSCCRSCHFCCSYEIFKTKLDRVIVKLDINCTISWWGLAIKAPAFTVYGINRFESAPIRSIEGLNKSGPWPHKCWYVKCIMAKRI